MERRRTARRPAPTKEPAIDGPADDLRHPATPERPSPDAALRQALQDAGKAIERIEPDERHERVRTLLDEQGILPDDPRARTFLVGVFVAAHWQRVKLDALDECTGAAVCGAALHVHGCLADVGGACTELGHGARSV